jgi:hypothetical protein
LEERTRPESWLAGGSLHRGFYFFHPGKSNERENDDRESSNYNGGETDRNRLALTFSEYLTRFYLFLLVVETAWQL